MWEVEIPGVLNTLHLRAKYTEGFQGELQPWTPMEINVSDMIAEEVIIDSLKAISWY